MIKIQPPISINPQIQNLITTYWQWRKLWIVTTVLFFGIGIAYAVLLKKDMWVASQAIIVRDEATGAVMRLGRFESQTQMKAAQETVLEMARSPQVVEAALTAVGRPAKFFGLYKSDAPPSKAEIEDFGSRCVSIRAPRGAELGTTEVIYLDVKEGSRDRAIQLTTEICNALETQLKTVRVELASGVIQELRAAQSVCEASLSEATEELKRTEVEAGADLADLRGLSDSSIGSTNRLMLDHVRDELRKADLSIKTMTPNVQLARAALDTPSLVLQAADVLASSHPAIDKLREGMSKAMVQTATLEGKYTVDHPHVLNAHKAEEAIQQNIRKELQIIVENYESAIAITEQKIRALNEQEQELGLRLNRLAQLRAKYSNLASEVKSRSDKLGSIKNELTETLATRDAAQASSLITRLDSPVLGEKPVGPGRSTIVGGAMVGGLMFGLGVVFLLAPLDVRVAGGQRCESELAEGRDLSASHSHASDQSTNPQNSRNSDSSASRGSAKSSVSKTTQVDRVPDAKRTEPTITTVEPALVKSEGTNSSSTSLGNMASSATAAARELNPKTTDSQLIKPRRAESLDDVRNLIAAALKTHAEGGE
ncbi:MAG: hypothetical protein U0930_20970 [Pirellulales bacterium]